MYAIVEIAGKQFKVTQDQFVYAPLMEGEEGASVEFDKVLLLDNDGNVEVGAPVLSGVKVSGKILGHVKGDKVIVFKKKRRKGFKKKNGHRQDFTKVMISEITSGNSTASKKKATAEKPADKAAEKPAKEKKETKADDLTEINGIGPVYAGELSNLGYTTFKQIAKLTKDQITEIAEKIDGVSEDMITNDEWVKQAKELSKK
jgi:large subunit ribosomal protein L21